MRKNLKYQAIKARDLFTRYWTLKTISLLSTVVLGLTLIPVGFLMDNDLMSKRNDQEIGRKDHSLNALKTSDIDYFNKDVVCQNYSFYLWNLTNSEDYLNGDKPQFEEIGPFVFRDHNYRENITYNEDDTEVNYTTYDRFEYLQDQSYNKLNIANTTIRNINPGYLSNLRTYGDEMGLFQFIFPEIMHQMREDILIEIAILLEETKEVIKEQWDGVSAVIMPQPNQVFNSEWMRDRMPMVELFIEGLDFLWLDPNTGELLGLGVNDPQDFVEDIDIDGRKDPVKWGSGAGKSRPDDLNMTTFDWGYANEHSRDVAVNQLCDALWNPDRECSLTYNPSNPDDATTEHWFILADFIDGNKTNSKSLIESAFASEFSIFNASSGITADVIDDLIVPWIQRSLLETFPHNCPPINKQIGDDGYGWLYNYALWTFDHYNGSFIIDRTVEEWLFTAFDGIVNWSRFESERDRAHVNFFNTANSYDEAYRSGLSEAEGGLNKRILNNITIKTGKNNVTETHQISALNGEQYINEWPQPESIRGTEGYKFHPNIQTSDTIEIFDINIMNRVMKFDYGGDIFLNGATGYKYELDSDMWTPNPDYYQGNELINLSTISWAPIYVSMPHFYHADDDFIDAVDGLNPYSGRSYHHYIDVEETTGITAEIKLRLQYNIEVEPTDLFYKDIYMWYGIPYYIPLLWFEQSSIPDFDNDTIPNYWEAFHSVDDPNGDLDDDGLNNLQEFHEYTDPNDEDSDDDKINDYHDPYPLYNFDLDMDGMPDDWEAFYGVDDPNGDPDGDGKTNLEEFLDGTDPTVYNKSADKEEEENHPSELPILIIIILIFGIIAGITTIITTLQIKKRKKAFSSKIMEKKWIKGIPGKPDISLNKAISSEVPEKERIKGVASKPDISLNKAVSSEENEKKEIKSVTAKSNRSINIYNSGLRLISQSKYKDAIKCFDNALKLHPDYIKAWYNKGSVHEILGMNKDALKCYEKILKINPNHKKAFLAKKRLLLHNKKI